MRGLILFLMLIALWASTAFAVPAKVAVFHEQVVENGQTYTTTITLLRKLGVPFDEFHPGTRTWNLDVSMDDSVYFRTNYAAVMIPYLDGQANGQPIVGSVWDINFKKTGGTAGVIHGPLSGRWGIPVFVVSAQRLVPSSSSYDDLTGNIYVAGIRHTSPAGTYSKPVLAEAGTWRYRTVARIRGNTLDTLWCDIARFGCRPSTWLGNGTVAALAWADTTGFGSNDGTGDCIGGVAGDTAMAAFRYRPTATGPGIYYGLIETGSIQSSNIGALLMLQYLFTITAVKPTLVAKLPLMEHDCRPGQLTTVANATLRRLHDTLSVNNGRRRVTAPMEGGELASMQNAQSKAEFIRVVTENEAAWYPWSYATGWTWQRYTAADTTLMRQRFNQLQAAATHTDTLGLPRWRYYPNRIAGAAGEFGLWQGRVLADAGVKVVSVLLNNTSVATNFQSFYGQCGSYGFESVPYSITGPNETRVIYAQFMNVLPHDSTFSKLRAGVNETEYYGKWLTNGLFAWTNSVHHTMYWHSGGVAGPSYTDPYYSFFMGRMLRTIKMFDKVIQLDTGFDDPVLTVRNTFTSRF